jgi:hypothetical protein
MLRKIFFLDYQNVVAENFDNNNFNIFKVTYLSDSNLTKESNNLFDFFGFPNCKSHLSI